MHYEQYYQIATQADYEANGIACEDLTTCRVIQQNDKTYTDMRGTGSFQLKKGMIIRHLEFSNGFMQNMWANASKNNDDSMIPFKLSELNIILENEPQEEE